MEEQLKKMIGSLLQEAIELRRLPLDERKERIVELALEINLTADDLYNAVLTSVHYLYKQAILATPERPRVYQEFLEKKNELLALIPDDLIPTPIKTDVYERLGELILGEESQEPTF